jgi:hypothetical protein
VFAIADHAAEHGGQVAATANESSVNLMRQHGMVQRYMDGTLALPSTFMVSGISLGQAELVPPVADNGQMSTFACRLFLLRKNWRPARTTSEASLQRHLCRRHQCKDYYILLLHFDDAVVAYEAELGFSHSQTAGYYGCLLAAIQHRPEDLGIMNNLGCV